MADRHMQASLDVRKLLPSITMTIHLKGVRRARARLLIGGWLIQMAAFVIGCGVCFDQEPSERSSIGPDVPGGGAW